MKTLHLISVVVIFIFFATGCGNNDEKAAEKTSEEIAEKIIENATGNKVDIDVNKSGDKGSITIKGDNGEEVTISSNGNEIPDNFPSDIYLVKGEIASVGTINSGEGAIITIVVNTEEESAEISRNILKEMKANGWKNEMNMTSGDGGMQMYSKDDNNLTVTMGKDNDKTQVSYMATVSKK